MNAGAGRWRRWALALALAVLVHAFAAPAPAAAGGDGTSVTVHVTNAAPEIVAVRAPPAAAGFSDGARIPVRVEVADGNGVRDVTMVSARLVHAATGEAHHEAFTAPRGEGIGTHHWTFRVHDAGTYELHVATVDGYGDTAAARRDVVVVAAPAWWPDDVDHPAAQAALAVCAQEEAPPSCLDRLRPLVALWGILRGA